MHKLDNFGIDSSLPLIVFVGRSNVGKSSLIRALTGKKIRVGKRPGSTRWASTVDVGTVTIVDIPGFGYMAKQGKTTIEKMKTRIVQNLERWGERMVLAILVVDISLFRELVERWEQRGEIPIDLEFYSFLVEISPNVLVVANKIDKLKKRERDEAIEYFVKRLSNVEPQKPLDFVVTSAQKRRGISKLKKQIEFVLKKAKVQRPNW